MHVEAGAIGVCHGPRCSDYGGRTLAETLEARGVSCEQLACQSLCTYAPTARVDGVAVLHATAEGIALRLQE
ncbi:MAG: hypothetical protein COW18_11030 [Zetaproteobacteria bacterium CG12_big_fil_rev_8_21_14_0_65_54_13]|nr:MAG: hypothetical protein COW18_11030 [Zetaproteobacteria bacterium CG12_big_fil_rev_8_21_14_0_65_54_13]PIX53418.1 MAG: hypothetical protein COZ50_13470 [Zetaproteobacteria bacterium CG_4_10_14_3_um_filter_54_28]PJA30985.1 MAG: hypothetical protein CO188_00840 [Zetaproteobacteria bacterium CG_4_9_14_3_um_filter_54_145]